MGRPVGGRRGSRRRTGVVLVVALAALLLPAAGCGKKRAKRQGVFVDARVLYERARGYLDRRSLRKTKLTLEQIQYTVENRAELEPLVRLMLADVSFFEASTLSLIDARAQYLDFVTLYSDHPRAPYAQLQAGVCSLEMANDPSRDQSEIRQAMDDLREVVERYPDSDYARAARDKLAEAQTGLAEHEFIVGRFYLKRGAYEAAAGRFRLALERYPRYRNKDKVYFHMGKARLLGGSDVEARLYFDKLFTDYPASEWTAEAQRFLDEMEKRQAALDDKRKKKKSPAPETQPKMIGEPEQGGPAVEGGA